MILAIDVGNTNIIIGVIDAKKTYFVERITTTIGKPNLEYAVALKSILEIYHIAPDQLDGAIVSSVVPPLNRTILAAIRKITGLNAMLVGSGMKTGLNILMDNPKSVGSDMIVNAVGALAEHEPPIIIIEMGTATTMSVIDKNGRYVGGAILPGLRVSLDSMSASTAQLPRISLDTAPCHWQKYHRLHEKRRHIWQCRDDRRYAGSHRGRTRRENFHHRHRRHLQDCPAALFAYDHV